MDMRAYKDEINRRQLLRKKLVLPMCFVSVGVTLFDRIEQLYIMWSMLMPINEIGFDKIKAIGFLIPVLSSSTWRISYHWRTGLLVPDGMVACS